MCTCLAGSKHSGRVALLRAHLLRAGREAEQHIGIDVRAIVTAVVSFCKAEGLILQMIRSKLNSIMRKVDHATLCTRPGYALCRAVREVIVSEMLA